MKSLITKLQGTVANENLLKVGEFRVSIGVIDSPTKNTQFLLIESDSNTTVDVKNGYLTDDSLTNNLGTHKETQEGQLYFHFANTNSILSFLNKYGIKKISCSKNKTIAFDIAQLMFCKGLYHILTVSPNIVGDIGAFKYMENIQEININSNKLYGNISVFADKTSLSSLTLAGSNIYGDLSVFSNKPLTTLSIAGTRISGSINGIVLNKIVYFLLPPTVTGKVDKATFSGKTHLFLQDNNLVSGDISLTNGLIHINNDNDNNNEFTWGTGTPNYFIALEKVHFKTDEDVVRMLQKEATLSVNSAERYPKNIIVYSPTGNTTGAESAISSLKANSIKIIVNGVEL